MSSADTGPQVWCGPQRRSLARLSLELHTEAFRRLASSMSSWRAESDCGLIRSSSGTGMRLTAPPDIRSTDSLSKSMWLRISDFLSEIVPFCLITVYHEKGHPVTRHEKAGRRDTVPADPLQWYPNTMVPRAEFEPATFVTSVSSAIPVAELPSVLAHPTNPTENPSAVVTTSVAILFLHETILFPFLDAENGSGTRWLIRHGMVRPSRMPEALSGCPCGTLIYGRPENDNRHSKSNGTDGTTRRGTA